MLNPKKIQKNPKKIPDFSAGRAAGATAVARAAKAAALAATAGIQSAAAVARIYNKESERAQSEAALLVPPVMPPPLPSGDHTHLNIMNIHKYLEYSRRFQRFFHKMNIQEVEYSNKYSKIIFFNIHAYF